MAKQSKALPARKRDEEALLVRSAESLGRIIGSLQRQLDGVSSRFAETADQMMNALPGGARNGGRTARTGTARSAGTRKAAQKAGRKTKTRRESGASKVQSTADRTSKRAAKSAAAKKTAGSTRSGTRKAARKTSRGG